MDDIRYPKLAFFGYIPSKSERKAKEEGDGHGEVCLNLGLNLHQATEMIQDRDAWRVLI